MPADTIHISKDATTNQCKSNIVTPDTKIIRQIHQMFKPSEYPKLTISDQLIQTVSMQYFIT